MSSSTANIDALNEAIEGIVQDAERMHDLILESTDELKRANNVGREMAEEAARVADGLVPLGKQIGAQREDTSAMLEETKAQRTALLDAMEKSFEAAKKQREEFFSTTKREREESFESFRKKALNEVEKTRDTLQTDFLSFKMATGTRIENLETQTTKLNESAENVESKLSEQVDTIKSKLLIPVYVAIGLGAVNFVCLILLLLK